MSVPISSSVPDQPAPTGTLRAERALLDLMLDQLRVDVAAPAASGWTERPATDPASALLEQQRSVLDLLMGPALAARLRASERADPAGAPDQRPPLTLAGLLASVGEVVWQELDDPQTEITAARRALQQEYVQRLELLLQDGRRDPGLPTLALARALLQRLAAATLARSPTACLHTRDHLEACTLALRSALGAAA